MANPTAEATYASVAASLSMAAATNTNPAAAAVLLACQQFAADYLGL